MYNFVYMCIHIYLLIQCVYLCINQKIYIVYIYIIMYIGLCPNPSSSTPDSQGLGLNPGFGFTG